MSKIMNWMMGEYEAGRFEFREPPDYPDEAEYYGTGITWGQARDMLDNAPPEPGWTAEQLDDYERSFMQKKGDSIPFDQDEIPF